MNTKNKYSIGIVLGLFLGLLGLIIGLLLYPYNSIERKTFIDGWLASFTVGIIVCVVLIVLYFSIFTNI